ILRKDKCLATIGERPAEVMDDSKWDEMDGNAISNLHLALPDGVFNVLSDYLVFDDVVAAILEEENRRNNREDRQTSSRQVEALVVTRGECHETGPCGVTITGNVASTSEDGNALCCEAAVAYKSRKRFADVWLFDRELLSYDAQEELATSPEVQDTNSRLSWEMLGCKKESKGSSQQHTLLTEWNLAERMNRTLLERARAMLATASLGKSFWAEAVNTACYVINRSPSTAVELKTPMEMWTGKPVNYSDLHIFGSPVYVMYNTQETTKLDPKSRKCLFLGYADGVKGYRLWDPTAHKVVVSRDVVFMEDKVQENEESDSTTRETTTIQMEKEFQSNDSSEAVPQHEVNETESQAPKTRTSDRERRRPGWQSDYVMESNVAYCLLTEEGEPSTLQEALNNPDASFWKEAMLEEIEALINKHGTGVPTTTRCRKPIGNKWV
ncbi:gag-pol polyprotein, partial [Tanacetum coccineum]